MRTVEKLAETTFGNLQSLLRNRRARKAKVCRDFLALCDERIQSRPGTGVRLAAIGVRLASSLESDCLKARSFAVLGSAHRASGANVLATSSFDVVERHARTELVRPACIACAADLLRRKAYLHYAKGDLDRALRAIDHAIDLYDSAGDLNAKAKALIARAPLNFYRFGVKPAIEDTSVAILLLHPKESRYRCAAYHNLTILLAESSSFENVSRAIRLMPLLRRRLRGVRGLTAERAKLKWLEALISHRLGWSGRAERLLETARSQLIKLGLIHDLAAITVDIARVRWPERNGINSVCRRSLEFFPLKYKTIIDKVLEGQEDPLLLLTKLRTAASKASIPEWEERRAEPIALDV